MRLQILDDSARFACGSCTACCDQPWRTMIEASRARALDDHDFSAYPQLAGKRFYDPTPHRPAADPSGTSGRDIAGREPRHVLAKGEGNRCLFLDSDGLCIIHRELGPEAKPAMCRQFPFLAARNWTEDRISVNFGCPAVQARSGPSLAEQREAIARVLPPSDRPARPDAPVLFDLRRRLTQPEAHALLDQAVDCFAGTRAPDIWTAFARVCDALDAVSEQAEGEADSGPAHEVQRFPRPEAAPMPVRFLFAATLYPDTLPADAANGLGLLRRLTLIPRLMSLATFSGGYASRLLGRNVDIAQVMNHPVEPDPEPEATALLLRYFRSRLWHRTLAGTRLPLVGAIHQHIHDLNAILFFARAEAARRGEARLGESLIGPALTRVEFHLANQARLYDHTLKGWLRARLCDAGLARAALGLLAPRQARTV